MNCELCRELLGELILGCPDELSEAEKAQIEVHLAECPTCQKESELLKTIRGCLPSTEDIARKIPENSVDWVRYMVMDRVRGASKRSSTRKLWWVWPASAAAAVILAVGLFKCVFIEKDKTPMPEIAEIQSDKPEVSTPKEISELEKHFTAITDSHDAIELLKRQYDKAKSDPMGGDFKELIALCEKLASCWPNTWAAIKAQDLTSKCYAQMGNPKKSQEVYLAYAEALGAMPGQGPKRCLEAIAREADRLFYFEKDYLGALSYYDILLAQYPDTEDAYRAEYMVGRYYEAIEQPIEAVQAYERLLAKSIPSALAAKAYQSLSQAYTSAKKYEKAIAVLKTFAGKFKDDNSQVHAYMKIGMIQYARGEMYCPDAIAALSVIKDKYPKHAYAKNVSKTIASMRSSTLDRMFDELAL